MTELPGIYKNGRNPLTDRLSGDLCRESYRSAAMTNKNCYLIGVILTFTLLLLRQNASSCSTFTTVMYGGVYTFDNVNYTCDYTVDICRGGCSSTMTYEVHIQESNVNPRSKCKVDASQCVSVGINTREIDLENCHFTSNGSQVSASFSETIWRNEPTGCNCASQITGSQSASECMENFIRDY